MSVHVLDTGAVYLLHEKHKPALWSTLRQAGAVLVPAIVLLEAGQSRELMQKRMERILEVADVIDTFPTRVAHGAAAALRRVNRRSCGGCGALVRPSLVDAIVMAMADEYTCSDEVHVHTSDPDDLRALAESFPRVVVAPLT